MTTQQKQFRKLSTAFEKLDVTTKDMSLNDRAIYITRLNTSFKSFVHWTSRITHFSKRDFLRLIEIQAKHRPMASADFMDMLHRDFILHPTHGNVHEKAQN